VSRTTVWAVGIRASSRSLVVHLDRDRRERLARKAVLYLSKNDNVPACPPSTGLDVMSAAHTVVVSYGPSQAGISHGSGKFLSSGLQPMVVADGTVSGPW
jgi:hypothetical protein